MGQTLTHGIYLPDEGERNCYDGLASNWSILDGAVGTIAEHTTALAGKAPLVHTHTKADITDFPAYGTTAGTICEGNDSRLSDARTPVAHTHGKADITDLFNSANTWSAINSYSAGIKLQGSRTAYILPEFAASYSGLSLLTYNANGGVKIGVFIESNNTPVLDTTKGYLGVTTGEVNSANIVRLEPIHGDTADLGTSSNRWKTLNGINPGALSLPNGSDNDTNWTGDLTILDGSTYNEKTFLKDGWVTVNIPGTAGNFILANNGQGQIVSNVGTGTQTNCAVTFPVRANTRVYIQIKIQSGEQVKHAIWTGCAGNV